jgi:phosphatidylserine decarboxylase
LRLEKGAEMGRFNMGSTVILILPPDTIDWLPGVQARDRICMGQTLARVRGARQPS